MNSDFMGEWWFDVNHAYNELPFIWQFVVTFAIVIPLSVFFQLSKAFYREIKRGRHASAKTKS
jgi:hypothetical protein